MAVAVATLAFLLLAAAWTVRRRRRVHVPLALLGILLDLGLVVALEVQRSVVAQVRDEPLPWFETVHVAASTLAVLLYVPTLVLGLRLWLGSPAARLRAWHVRLATAALGARTVGFAFMWTLPGGAA